MLAAWSPAACRLVFAAALTLMLVNDWVFKTHVLLPGWLRGKLSDGAFMLVAPVVLAALLARLGVGRRLAAGSAAGLVAVTFTTIELSRSAARWFDGALSALAAAIEVPCAAVSTADPSDLLVLPLVAGGAMLATRLARDPVLGRTGTLALGVLACTATSYSHHRVGAHWGFADDQLGSVFISRSDKEVVLLRLGRHTKGGGFELDVQLVAAGRPLTAALDAVTATSGTITVAAEIPPGQPRRLHAEPSGAAVGRIVVRGLPSDGFVPAELSIPLVRGDVPSPLLVSLSFKERMLTWSEVKRRFE